MTKEQFIPGTILRIGDSPFSVTLHPVFIKGLKLPFPTLEVHVFGLFVGFMSVDFYKEEYNCSVGDSHFFEGTIEELKIVEE